MSSSSDPLQNSFDSYEPKQELESPFLNEEYLADEARIAQWRVPVPGIQLESPFLEAFEDGWRSGEVEEFEGFLDESDEEEFEKEAIDNEFSSESEMEIISYEQDEFELLHEQLLEERFEPSAISKDVANALNHKDWSLALKLSIQEGWRDESELTNLIFFARHPELPLGDLDPKDPMFRQLSDEWTKILNNEVWKAIQISANNTDLVVSGEEVIDHHRRFFQGKSGKRLKQLVKDAAREVDLNPGLIGTIMMAETRRPQSYLSREKVSSYHIGADDFYEGRTAIKNRVPAYAKVKWDKSQTPLEHFNDAKRSPRKVKTILFDSGSDAVLATAVYVKFYEVRLREIAADLKGDFDKLPLAIQLALTRMAMAAGAKGATPFLQKALKRKDIFIRKAIPVVIYQTQRNATVRTAQAMHLSDWIFGIPLPSATAQPELEAFEGFNNNAFGDDEFENDAEASYKDVEYERAEEIEHLDYEAEYEKLNEDHKYREHYFNSGAVLLQEGYSQPHTETEWLAGGSVEEAREFSSADYTDDEFDSPPSPTPEMVKYTKMPEPVDDKDSIGIHEINLPLFYSNKKRLSPDPFEVMQSPRIANCPVASILAAMAFTKNGQKFLRKMLTVTVTPTLTDISEVKEKLNGKKKGKEEGTLKNPPSDIMQGLRFFTVNLPGGSVEVSDVLYTNDYDAGWSPIYMHDPHGYSIWAAIIEKALAVKLGSYNDFDATDIKANQFWEKIVGKPPDGFSVNQKTPLEKIIGAARKSTRVPTIGASRDDDNVKIVTPFHGFAMLGLYDKKIKGKKIEKMIKLYDPAKADCLYISPIDFQRNFQTILFHQ
jgi:hypothetical protein